jgi:hypothetical protein
LGLPATPPNCGWPSSVHQEIPPLLQNNVACELQRLDLDQDDEKQAVTCINI